MTRVHHARPQHAPQRNATLDQSRAAVRKKKPYKILLEAVTQEKKKLHSILTYASNAPAGFGFVPAGHPEFTEWCKEQCRQRNLDVHIVSAKPKNKMHSDPEKLSHHVHRVGHHFPLEIIKLACSKFDYTYDEAHGLRKMKESERSNWIAQRFEDYSSRQVLHGSPSNEQDTKGYISGAVREMFPKIPEPDVQAIVNQAFAPGTKRVGNATELSLARRVQLAVVAHIRHTYTDYDKLLKSGTWMDARSKVEHVSLAKLKEWRDEAGEQSNEIEETFREVIVLDDDDEGTSEDDSLGTPDEREQSMEIVSSRATARDLQPELHANYPHMDIHGMRRAPRRTIVVSRYPPPPRPATLSGAANGQLAPQQQQQQPSRAPVPSSDSRPESRSAPYHLAHSRPSDSRLRPTFASSPRSAQPVLSEINGQLYQLQPIEEAHGVPRMYYDPPPRAAPRHMQNEYVQPSSPRFSSFDRAPAHSRRPSDQDVVLPSVEREAVDLTSSPQRVAAPQRDHNVLARPYDETQSPRRRAFQSFAENGERNLGHVTKRLRPTYDDEIRGQSFQERPSEFLSYQSPESRNRPRVPPSEQIIDLTSSPHRLPTNGDRGPQVSTRPYAIAEPNGHAYISMSTRRSPARELRGAYYEGPGEPPRSYIPDNRMYERRAPPVHDYIPLEGHQLRPRIGQETARYHRSGVRYGA